VSFDASGSHDVDGDAIVEYRFNFGDGSTPVTQTTPKISHTYIAAGSFTASVVVKDSAGNSSPQASVVIEAKTTVVVEPGPTGPVAALVITPTSGTAPLLVNFDGSNSFDADGKTITQYIFDFGDGSAVLTQSNPKTTHTYTAAGSYTPTLKVKNTDGVVSKAASGAVAVNPSGTGGDGGTDNGKGGGGAFGLGLLLSLLGAAGLRLRRRY